MRYAAFLLTPLGASSPVPPLPTDPGGALLFAGLSDAQRFAGSVSAVLLSGGNSHDEGITALPDLWFVARDIALAAPARVDGAANSGFADALNDSPLPGAATAPDQGVADVDFGLPAMAALDSLFVP